MEIALETAWFLVLFPYQDEPPAEVVGDSPDGMFGWSFLLTAQEGCSRQSTPSSAFNNKSILSGKEEFWGLYLAMKLFLKSFGLFNL